MEALGLGAWLPWPSSLWLGAGFQQQLCCLQPQLQLVCRVVVALGLVRSVVQRRRAILGLQAARSVQGAAVGNDAR